MIRYYPLPGDLIQVERSEWYALEDGQRLRVSELAGWQREGKDISVVPRKAASTFWGPQIGPPDGKRRHVMSTSGGPFKTLVLADYPDMRRIDRVSDRFWHWQDFPRAGGGIEREVQVALWFLPVLFDGRSPRSMRSEEATS